MNYYYITGTGSGLGKAIAEKLLENNDNIVFGLSRKKTVNHPNYHHFTVDLNENLKTFNFPEHSDALSINLINNAGILGPVKPVGKIDHQDLKLVIRVNLTAPLILIDKFVRTYQGAKCKKVIVNISSGAARYPFNSWMTYCASKAGLDMASQVLATEQKDVKNKISVFSVAPGIIDTPMQEEIRKADPADFPMLQMFRDYKEKEQLWPPEKTAEHIIRLCKNPEGFSDVLLDVRKM